MNIDHMKCMGISVYKCQCETEQNKHTYVADDTCLSALLMKRIDT